MHGSKGIVDGGRVLRRQPADLLGDRRRGPAAERQRPVPLLPQVRLQRSGRQGGRVSCPCSDGHSARVIEVTSIDHSSGLSGQYFNFDRDAVGLAEGATEYLVVTMVPQDGGPLMTGEIVVWGSANGGATGNAHGRFNGNPIEPTTDQFAEGDILTTPCEAPEPEATCDGDVNRDDTVNVVDVLELLGAFGGDGGVEDLNGDGTVDVVDLLFLLSNVSHAPGRAPFRIPRFGASIAGCCLTQCTSQFRNTCD